MRYLVAVSGCETPPFPMLENGIRSTWGGKVPPEISVLYYYCKPGTNRLTNDRLYLDHEDGVSNQSMKARLFIKWLLTIHDLECVYFTNLSSYIRLNKLLDIFNSSPKRGFYSGLIGLDSKGQPEFASGAGFFITRDLLELMSENDVNINWNLPSDVVFGKFLLGMGINIIPQPRLDLRITNYKNYSNVFKDHFHFRCKQGDRRCDVEIMKYIYIWCFGDMTCYHVVYVILLLIKI